MNPLEMKLGTKLTALRRAKGLTQEQLAEKLGVSAPAVSKWETDTSYPDITLLCPLARALDTNVDTLLQFEEKLSDQEVAEIINGVVAAARQDGYEASERRLFEALHRYPNSAALKFNAALVWDVFAMFFPSTDEKTREEWTAHKKELLAEVRASQAAAYWQSATLKLAEIAIAEDRLTEAEALLQELPEHIVDPTAVRSLLYLKKKEPQDALKTAQRRLYDLVRQVQSCLAVMLNPGVTPDPETALQICEIYRSVDQLFGLGGLYDGLFLEIYCRMNRYEEAADCLSRYAEAVTGDATLPNRLLFSPGLDIKERQPATPRELRQLLLHGFEEEEQIKPLLSYPQCQAALQKIRDSLT